MRNLSVVLVCLFLMSCGETIKKKQLTDAYKTEIATYRKELNERRKNGYLQLTGLFKLNDSILVFGLDGSKQVTLNPKHTAIPLGMYHYQDSILVFSPSDEANIKMDSSTLSGSIPVQFDEYGSSQMWYDNNLRWQMITRSHNHYLRIWDSLNPAIEAFKGFKHYDLNPDFIYDEA